MTLDGNLATARITFTTRTGGVSSAPFDSLNLGDHVGDDPAHVARNREIVHERLGVKPVYLKQVHGTDVAVLNASTPDGTVADACVATQRGLACTIMVADCLPVLFADAQGDVVGAAHAGWRGLAEGVLERTLAVFLEQKRQFARMEPAQGAMKSVVDAKAQGIHVWLGPCIGPGAFEVGQEVREAFVSHSAQASQCFKPHGEPSGGKYLADLAGLARQRLQAAGITHIEGNDGSPPWCTVTNESAFFSHRRDAVRLGSSGRMAACIWL
jgi:polyphenol oxidase